MPFDRKLFIFALNEARELSPGATFHEVRERAWMLYRDLSGGKVH